MNERAQGTLLPPPRPPCSLPFLPQPLQVLTTPLPASEPSGKPLPPIGVRLHSPASCPPASCPCSTGLPEGEGKGKGKAEGAQAPREPSLQVQRMPCTPLMPRAIP